MKKDMFLWFPRVSELGHHLASTQRGRNATWRARPSWAAPKGMKPLEVSPVSPVGDPKGGEFSN